MSFSFFFVFISLLALIFGLFYILWSIIFKIGDFISEKWDEFKCLDGCLTPWKKDKKMKGELPVPKTKIGRILLSFFMGTLFVTLMITGEVLALVLKPLQYSDSKLIPSKKSPT
jgi:hypothetical protein